MNILSGSVPTPLANSACLFNILYSPWTGRKNFGLAMACINFNSSCLACPDTCMSAISLDTTSAPFSSKKFITFDTVFSFPGIGCAEIITRSPFFISTFLCSELAILAKADIGSPWDPVVIMTNSLSLYLWIELRSMMCSSVLK